MNEEGWFKDPYQRLETRWMSAGTPTALVRDAGVESQDAPPDEPITVETERVVAEAIPGDASDLKRADDAATPFDGALSRLDPEPTTSAQHAAGEGTSEQSEPRHYRTRVMALSQVPDFVLTLGRSVQGD
jgi:hypothetical protein